MNTNKRIKIIEITLDIIIIILGVVFLISGIKDAVIKFNKYRLTDEKRFSGVYNLSLKDNRFKTLSIKEAKMNVFNDITILVGNPTDSWTRILVKPLNDIYKEKNKTIYYLEINDDIKKTNEYKEFLKVLKVKSLNTPSIIISKNGKISISRLSILLTGIDKDILPFLHEFKFNSIKLSSEVFKYLYILKMILLIKIMMVFLWNILMMIILKNLRNLLNR